MRDAGPRRSSRSPTTTRSRASTSCSRPASAARRRRPDPRLLPGVEINTVDGGLLDGTELGRRGGELHILGLGVDPGDPALTRGARRSASSGAASGSRRRSTCSPRSASTVRALPAAAARRHRVARPPARGPSAGRGRPCDLGRGRLRALPRPRPAGVRAADGHRATRGDRGDHRGRRRRRARAPARAPTRSPPIVRQLVDWGLGGLEAHYPTFEDATTAQPRRARGEPRAARHRGLRLPWRHDELRRRADDAPRPRRRRRRTPGGPRRRTRGVSPRTLELPVLDIAPPARRDPRLPLRADARRRVLDRAPGPAALPRLDARLPDERVGLRGDGGRAAGRRLRRGAEPRGGRPHRHQHVRDPRDRRAEGHRADGRARPAEGGEPADARRAHRLRGPRRQHRHPAAPLPGGRPVPAPRPGARAHRPPRARRRDRARTDGERSAPARRALRRGRRGPAAGDPGRRGRRGARRARQRRPRLAADHLRLRQDVHVLHRPVQPRPGAQPPVRRRPRRGPRRSPTPATSRSRSSGRT